MTTTVTTPVEHGEGEAKLRSRARDCGGSAEGRTFPRAACSR